MATWLSEEEAGHDRNSVESAQAGRILNKSGHLHAEADNSNPNETEEGRSSDQPKLEGHQTAPLRSEVTGGNTRNHLDHPDRRPESSKRDEGDKLSAEGRRTNIDTDTQQLPITITKIRAVGTY